MGRADPQPLAETPSAGTAIEIGLNAAIVTVAADMPLILTVGERDEEGLPFGPFDPLRHRTLEIGLRSWVEEQTALSLGYVEQLYSFGDRGRHAVSGDTGPHVVSVGYLALTRIAGGLGEERAPGTRWSPWYAHFPWEDWRAGRPDILDAVIAPALEAWAGDPPGAEDERRPFSRRTRLRLAFGSDDMPWDEERVLDRYELLYETGLVEEALRDGRAAALRRGRLAPLGRAMRFDHRRILATAVSRLRAKLKYRPVVFELLGPEFTLTELQRTVEAIAGRHLHKQNFRRLVEAGRLVEPTGAVATGTGGRPAALFRFRREVLQERPHPGLRFGARG